MLIFFFLKEEFKAAAAAAASEKCSTFSTPSKMKSPVSKDVRTRAHPPVHKSTVNPNLPPLPSITQQVTISTNAANTSSSSNTKMKSPVNKEVKPKVHTLPSKPVVSTPNLAPTTTSQQVTATITNTSTSITTLSNTKSPISKEIKSEKFMSHPLINKPIVSTPNAPVNIQQKRSPSPTPLTLSPPSQKVKTESTANRLSTTRSITISAYREKKDKERQAQVVSDKIPTQKPICVPNKEPEISVKLDPNLPTKEFTKEIFSSKDKSFNKPTNTSSSISSLSSFNSPLSDVISPFTTREKVINLEKPPLIETKFKLKPDPDLKIKLKSEPNPDSFWENGNKLPNIPITNVSANSSLINCNLSSFDDSIFNEKAATSNNKTWDMISSDESSVSSETRKKRKHNKHDKHDKHEKHKKREKLEDQGKNKGKYDKKNYQSVVINQDNSLRLKIKKA